MINNSLLGEKRTSAIYFTINGNMTAQSNSKTGDVMWWVVEGVGYAGNNTPAHIFMNVGGEGLIKSSDKFLGLRDLSLSSCNLVTLNLEPLGAGKFPSRLFFNNNQSLSEVRLPQSSQPIDNFECYSDVELPYLDLSGLTGLGGTIKIYSCTKLSTLVLPVSSREIVYFFAYSNPELLNLDLSGLTGLGGDVRLYGCTKLTTILFPATNKIITRLELPSASQVITIDLSSLTNLGGNIQLISCTKLTSLYFPTSSQNITIFYLYSNIELLSLNLGGLSGLGGNIQIYNCIKLTNIIFPTSSQSINTFLLYSNPELVSLDLSGLTGLGGNIRLYGCTKLTSLILPSTNVGITAYYVYGTKVPHHNLSTLTNISNGITFLFQSLTAAINTFTTAITLPTHATATVSRINANSLPNLAYFDVKVMPNMLNATNSTFQAQNNNWSASIVNQILHELNIGATSGFTGRTINIGGTNADPDATTGGYDGLAAKAALEAKGITVTII